MGSRKVVVSATVVVLFAVVGLALAQRGGMGRGGRGGFGPGGGPGPGGPFDAAQLRQALTAVGATEADLQAVENYRTAQRSLMEPLLQAVQSLRETAGESATQEQAAQAVSKYEALKTRTLAQSAEAEKALKAQLKLSTKPKLHAGAAVFLLRRRRPDLPRPYRAWGYPVVPALFCLSSLALTINHLWRTPSDLLWLTGFLAAGVPVYLCLRHRARTNQAM